MLVSGTLNPDASGLFERVGDYGGQHAWTRQTPGWSIWYCEPVGGFVISAAVGQQPTDPDNWWFHDFPPGDQLGAYSPVSPATGTATVSSQ